MFRERRFLLALLPATALAALATGIPTDVLPNPWFTRMTPVRTLDVVTWPLLSLFIGALVATYAVPSCREGTRGLSTGAGGGVLGVFAIGCPVCNKVVVLALGFTGALTYFAPIQPAIAVGSLALTGVVLRGRLRAYAAGCRAAHAEPPAPGSEHQTTLESAR